MHPVFATILKRLFLGLVTLFIVSVIIFTSIQMLPGDFGEAILGQAATDETVAAFRKELGLDKPALWRYFDWVGALAAGDLGNSFSGRAGSGIDRSRAVIDLVAPRLWNTLFLASMTAIIAVPLALFLGITTALWRNTAYDKMASASTLTAISLPEFFVAYILILLFGTLWPILKIGNQTAVIWVLKVKFRGKQFMIPCLDTELRTIQNLLKPIQNKIMPSEGAFRLTSAIINTG